MSLNCKVKYILPDYIIFINKERFLKQDSMKHVINHLQTTFLKKNYVGVNRNLVIDMLLKLIKDLKLYYFYYLKIIKIIYK
jgi:hypothetical protein